MGYWKIQLVLTENRAGVIETGWTWTGGSSTTKDIWTEIWGDGIEAAVKDGGAIVYYFLINYFKLFIKYNYYFKNKCLSKINLNEITTNQ